MTPIAELNDHLTVLAKLGFTVEYLETTLCLPPGILNAWRAGDVPFMAENLLGMIRGVRWMMCGTHCGFDAGETQRIFGYTDEEAKKP
jgi:hypothetical protein